MTSSLYQRPEYVHALLNHLPVVGLAAALLTLGVALFSRSSRAVVPALVLVGLFAASVWPVIETGESAYNRIRAISDPDGAALLKQHMFLADRWAWVYYVTCALALAGAVAAWKQPKWQGLIGLVVALAACASLVAGVSMAKLGGQVRHPEFRPGTTLVPEGEPAGHDRDHATE